MLAGHEVLRLQLFTCARREAHAKVRQSFIPRPGNTHLLRTVLGGEFRDGVEILGGTFRPEEYRSCFKSFPLSNATIDPNFVDTLLMPVSKKTYTVRPAFDIDKVD